MARNFNGSSDYLVLSSGAATINMGGITLAAIAKRAADGTYDAIMTAMPSTGGEVWNLKVSDAAEGNHLFGGNGTIDALAAAPTFLAADGWCLVAMTKVTGSIAPRYHKYVFSTNTWTHQNSTDVLADGSALDATGTIRVGNDNFSSFFTGDIAMLGIFNYSMTDLQVETLIYSLVGWYSASPIVLAMLDQSAVAQKVADLSGRGSNESSRTGTTVSTLSVPVFSYGVFLPAPSVAAAAGGTPVTSSDTGTGVDALSLIAALTSANTGVGVDAMTLTALLSLADVGVGADTFSVTVPVSSSDTGTGADTATVAAAITAADTGSGVDTLVVGVALVAADTGVGSDGTALVAQLAYTDSGTATDSFTVNVQGVPTFFETGLGSDSFSVVAKPSISETGSGVDVMSTVYTPAFSDTGTSTDSMSLVAKPVMAESGIGSDTWSMPTFVTSFTELATGVDTVALGRVFYAFNDTGVGIDLFVTATGVAIGQIKTGRIESYSGGDIAQSDTGKSERRLM